MGISSAKFPSTGDVVDRNTIANAQVAVLDRSVGGQPALNVDIFVNREKLQSETGIRQGDELSAQLHYRDTVEYAGRKQSGHQVRQGGHGDAQIAKLPNTSAGWEHYQLMVPGLNDPAEFKNHLSEMGIYLTAPGHSPTGEPLFASIDTVFVEAPPMRTNFPGHHH